MITTGGTIEAATKGLIDAGCKPLVSIVATHALLVPPAFERLERLPIQHLIATNSIESTSLPARFQLVNLGPLLAAAIGRLHRDQSLAPLTAPA